MSDAINRIDTTHFTPEQRSNALTAIYTSAGLQVVFDLIEEIVTTSENALIGEDPENEKAVIKRQYAAHYQRALFQSLTQNIDFMVADGQAPITPTPHHPSLEERANLNASLDLINEGA